MTTTEIGGQVLIQMGKKKHTERWIQDSTNEKQSDIYKGLSAWNNEFILDTLRASIALEEIPEYIERSCPAYCVMINTFRQQQIALKSSRKYQDPSCRHIRRPN